MSPTRPMMIAAVNGPIPWMSVTVVAEAVMIAAVRLRTSTRAASSTRISSSNWVPTATRSTVMAPSRSMLARSCSAFEAVRARPVPPLDEQTQQGVESTDRACPVGGDLMIAIGRQT